MTSTGDLFRLGVVPMPSDWSFLVFCGVVGLVLWAGLVLWSKITASRKKDTDR
jgi:hypothetical protein